MGSGRIGIRDSIQWNDLRWRWKPDRCELPYFDPESFLDLVENKHVAFAGDSLARNQLQSLLCMLQVAEKPHLFHTDEKNHRFQRLRFPSRNATFSIYWSPFLVKGFEGNSGDKDYNTVFLDSVDERWASEVKGVDILILSVGHWYFHYGLYYFNNSILGCHSFNCTEIGVYQPFRRALNTTFDEIIRQRFSSRKDLKVFLQTLTPSHFEGEWDKTDACSRTQPYNRSEQISFNTGT